MKGQDGISPVWQPQAVVHLLDTSAERAAASGDPGMCGFDDMEGWTPGTCDRNKPFRAGQTGGTRFNHTTRNGRQYESHELFTSRTFHVILSPQD